MMTHQELKAKLLKNPSTREAYETRDADILELDVRLKARAAREGAALTQAQVAERMHTSQQAVARFESSRSKRSPSLDTLIRYAKAVGCDLALDFNKHKAGPNQESSQN